MKQFARFVLAVVAGAAVWAVLWNVGTQATLALFPNLIHPGQPVQHTGILLSYIAFSVILSLLAGYVTTSAAGPSPQPALWTLATLQLALGIGFEVSYWALMPAWYHVTFLLLIVPATLYGGALRVRQTHRSPS